MQNGCPLLEKNGLKVDLCNWKGSWNNEIFVVCKESTGKRGRGLGPNVDICPTHILSWRRCSISKGIEFTIYSFRRMSKANKSQSWLLEQQKTYVKHIHRVTWLGKPRNVFSNLFYFVPPVIVCPRFVCFKLIADLACASGSSWLRVAPFRGNLGSVGKFSLSRC